MRHRHGEVHAHDGQVYSVATGKTFALIPYWTETAEQTFDQELIEEAFNVASETGMTPIDLQKINDELLWVAKALISSLDQGMRMDQRGLYERAERIINNLQ